MDAYLFMDLLTWFIKESYHKVYSEVTPPNDCPTPVIVLQNEDNDNDNNTVQD